MNAPRRREVRLYDAASTVINARKSLHELNVRGLFAKHFSADSACGDDGELTMNVEALTPR